MRGALLSKITSRGLVEGAGGVKGRGGNLKGVAGGDGETGEAALGAQIVQGGPGRSEKERQGGKPLGEGSRGTLNSFHLLGEQSEEGKRGKRKKRACA